MDKSFSEETHWERAAKTRLGRYLTQIETDFIFKSIDLSKAHSIMDVGAEAGRFSLLKTNDTATMLSIDINSYGLKRLKLKNPYVNAIQADARKIPLKSEVFDVIFMIEVLDYIPELEIAFKECFRTLKPDGSLILSFGNKSSFKSKLKGLRGRAYLHSYNNAVKCLSEAGFVVKKKVGYNWLPFGRTSQSRFVSLLAWFEGVFGLRRIPSLSPWVIIYAVKSV